jgi:hypothetical protein
MVLVYRNPVFGGAVENRSRGLGPLVNPLNMYVLESVDMKWPLRVLNITDPNSHVKLKLLSAFELRLENKICQQ